MKELTKFLINESDNPDEGVIYHRDTMYGTTTMHLLRKFNKELDELGFIDDYNFTHANYEVVYAVYKEACIGFIAFYHNKDGACINIMGAYVEPNYRYKSVNFSVYDLMFEQLIIYAKEFKPIRILSGTHINNKAAQKAFERQGRINTSLVYTYDID